MDFKTMTETKYIETKATYLNWTEKIKKQTRKYITGIGFNNCNKMRFGVEVVSC